MPNQDMLFPILPRPTPPVNLNDIVHHDVPRVEKQTETHKIDTEHIILSSNRMGIILSHTHQMIQLRKKMMPRKTRSLLMMINIRNI